MLPPAARLTKPAEFAAVLRLGRRTGTRHVAVHLLETGSSMPARAGFVVSSKVGNSVVRHRVTRRLRAQVRPVLGGLAAGTQLVVRAFPAAAAASSAALGRDIRIGVERARSRLPMRDGVL